MAQEPNPTTIAPGARSATVVTDTQNGTYIYHVKVVQRSLDAVNYLNRSGATHVNFIGTELLPKAKGDAKVDAKTGKIQISVKFDNLVPANSFGPEYLTYVLWAISADGRPQNLGELELAGDKASLDVTSSFQSFGMIVTAEPYFSVTQPSDVIVLKNVFSDRTQGCSSAGERQLQPSAEGFVRQHGRCEGCCRPNHQSRAHSDRFVRGL